MALRDSCQGTGLKWNRTRQRLWGDPVEATMGLSLLLLAVRLFKRVWGTTIDYDQKYG